MVPRGPWVDFWGEAQRLDLHVLAKLLEQCLERGEEAEALAGREIVAEHDLLQLGVAERVEVEVRGRSRRNRPFSTTPICQDAYAEPARAWSISPDRRRSCGVSVRGNGRRAAPAWSVARPAEVARQPRALRHEGVRAEHVRQSCAAYAEGAVGSPGGLEAHARRRLVPLDAEPVVEVDRRAVPGVRAAVAAVVGAEHAHAGLVVGPKRVTVGRGPPGAVAEADALADGTRRAGDAEDAGRRHVLAGGGPAPARGKPARVPSGPGSHRLAQAPVAGSGSRGRRAPSRPRGRAGRAGSRRRGP